MWYSHRIRSKSCEDMLHVASNILGVHPINRTFRSVLNVVQKLGDLDRVGQHSEAHEVLWS